MAKQAAGALPEADRALTRSLRASRAVTRVLLVLTAVLGLTGIASLIGGHTGRGILLLVCFVLLMLPIAIGKGRRQQRIAARLQDFCREETLRAFGPQLDTPEYRLDRARFDRTGMFQPLTGETITARYEGVCEGLHFSAANVRLRVPNTAPQSNSLDAVCFDGVWVFCRLAGPVSPSVTLFENPKNKRGRRDRSTGDVHTDDPEFDQVYSVFSDDPAAALAVLTPQRMALLRRLAEETDGEVLLCLSGDELNLGLRTEHGLFEIDDLSGSLDVPALQQRFLDSLRRVSGPLALLRQMHLVEEETP